MSWVWSYEDFVKWEADVKTKSDVIDEINILDRLVLYAREMDRIREAVEKVKKNEICPGCRAAIVLAEVIVLAEEISSAKGWRSQARNEYKHAKHTDGCVFRDGINDA